MLYQVRVDIYEHGNDYPLVTHLFHGRNEDEAHAVHDAHRTADALLRGCEDAGVYKSRVSCEVVITEGWVE